MLGRSAHRYRNTKFARADQPGQIKWRRFLRFRERTFEQGGYMKHMLALWKRLLEVELLSTLVLSIMLMVISTNCGSGKSTIVQITNKITSLPAGQTYVFNGSVEHNHKQGVSVSLTGAGTLVLNGQTAIYLAPPTPPTPNSVTVTLTGGGGSASDSDTFTITPAAGPVVSISPTQPHVSVSAGTPVTLNISVTEDDASDVLTASVSTSSNCGMDCGSFGAIHGTPHSGSYTVDFYPPGMVQSTLEIINVTSTLSNSTQGTSFVSIDP